MFPLDLPDMGPISVLNHRMVSLAFYRFTPRDARIRTDRAIRYQWTQSNDFRQLSSGSNTVSEDYEVTRLSATWQRPLGRGDLAIEVPFLSRGAGFLDPIIDGWHANVLGWSDPVRDSTPFGQNHVDLPGSGSFGNATGVGDISAQYTLPLKGNLSASAALKLPTGSASKLLGSGGLDAGLALYFSPDLGRKVRAHVMIGVVGQSDATDLQGTRGLVHQESIGLTFASNSRDRWIVQWQSDGAPMTTGVSGVDASHRIVTFGYRRLLNERSNLELYFSEDRDLYSGTWPEGANTGPDFTIGAAFTVRF